MTQQLNLESQSLAKLHKLLYQGQFAVPKLQRVFVWNGTKAAKLLDSLYRAMPIGALTIWDAPRSSRHLLRASASVIPPFNDANNRVWFVLDGQQRLSVLHRVLEGGVVTNGKHIQVDFAKLVFRVTDGEDVARFQYRKPVSREWISVTEILASNWKSRLVGLSTGQLRRAEVCRNKLLKYPVPIVKVEMDTIDEARELFYALTPVAPP